MSEKKGRCIICGANVPRAEQLYCGPACRSKGQFRMDICKQIDYLNCNGGDCSRCGWNPEVARRRKEKIYG